MRRIAAVTPTPDSIGRKLEPLDFPRPLTTVDVVIFAILDGVLQAVLVRRPTEQGEPFPDMWALPGGFVTTPDVGRKPTRATADTGGGDRRRGPTFRSVKTE